MPFLSSWYTILSPLIAGLILLRSALEYLRDEIGRFVPETSTGQFTGTKSSLLFVPPLLAVTSIVNDGVTLSESDYLLQPDRRMWPDGPYTWLERQWNAPNLGRWCYYKPGGISITATEMLESMTASPRPTRAEVTDVANAVLDGTDAVMLSAETAVGKYPVRTIEVMAAICLEAEASPGYPSAPPMQLIDDPTPFPAAIAGAVADTAATLGLDTVVAFTESGSTARLVARKRPNARIVAFTPHRTIRDRLAIVWGVTPLMFPRLGSTDEMIAEAERILLEMGLVARGEPVAMAAGIPPNQQASTNLLKLHVFGAEGGR